METFSKGAKKAAAMDQAMEMQALIKEIGKPLFSDEQRAFRIERAARKLGITPRAAKSYWYAERTNIPSSDMDKARQMAGEPLAQETSDELATLKDRISRLEAILLQTTHGGGAANNALRILAGGENRTLD